MPPPGPIVSHYRIIEKLGAGGMGEVYRATDLALGRTVALKLIAPGISATLKKRLIQEADASSRLQHPAIATFYEAGEADGTAFIAMEFVPGKTLRSVLSAERLPTGEALGVAACLLEALVHAHAAGVIHRDIKPENIMITGARAAKLLDFGLARSSRLEVSDEFETQTKLTGVGQVLGTVGYMAPEQLRGQTADHRCDLFAIGAVLYEALAGRPAFPGNTATERIANTLAASPAPLALPELPAGAFEVLRRAMSREPAGRQATAAAMLAELRQLAAGERLSELPQTVAVTDLVNLTGDPADEWIGTGIAESLRADLARLPSVGIVPQPKVGAVARSVATSPGTLDPVQLGSVLGCRWVIAGSVQRAGDRLRIAATLTDVATGEIASTEKLDGTVDGIFEIQDRLAVALSTCLEGGDSTGPERDTPRLDAYEAYNRGLKLFLSLQKGSMDQAAALYEQAIDADPDYAQPRAGLAAFHPLRFTFTTDRGDLDRAIAEARRAVELDRTLAEPHVWLGYALFRAGRLNEGATAEVRALELSPDSAQAHYFLGVIRAALGELTTAMSSLQTAARLNPEHSFTWWVLGWAHLEMGNANEAVWCYEQVAKLEETGRIHLTVGAAGYLGECLRRVRRLAEARRCCLAGLATIESSDHMLRDTFRATCLCVLGQVALDQDDHEGARAAFGQAVAQLRGRTRTLSGGNLLVHALCGLARVEGNRERLEEAVRIFEEKQHYDFSWMPFGTEALAEEQIALARGALEREA